MLRIPAGKMVDKYGVKPFMILGISAASLQYLFMANATNLYLIAAIFLIPEIIQVGSGVAEGKLWYAATPQKIFPIGVAIRNTVYGVSATVGAPLAAYIWSRLGPKMSFYMMSAYFFAQVLIVAFLIKEP